MRPCSSPAMPASDEVDIIYVNIYRQVLMSDTILSINVYKMCKIGCIMHPVKLFSICICLARLEQSSISCKHNSLEMLRMV